MAVKKNSEVKSVKEAVKKVNYKEFKYSGATFEWSGRIFPGKEGHGKIKKRWGLTLSLNGVLDIKGCYLTETESNVFISWPQYATGENKDKWNSYIYVSKDLNEEIDALVNVLMGVVGIDGEAVAKAPEKDEDMPF